MKLDEAKEKTASWFHEVVEIRGTPKFDVPWVNNLVGEMVPILEHCHSTAVAVVMLEFLYHMSTDSKFVQYAYEGSHIISLLMRLKRFLMNRDQEVERKTFKVLSRMLQTAEDSKKEFPVLDVYPRTIFDNVAETIIYSDIDYCATSLLTSTNTDVINKAVEFYYNLFVATKFCPRKVWPVMDNVIRTFNFVVNEPKFEHKCAAAILAFVAKSAEEIAIDFQQKVRIFTARVIDSSLWKPEEKIDIVYLMELCISKSPPDDQNVEKITLQFSYILKKTQNFVELEPLRFVAFLFKKDLSSSALHFPEFENMADSKEVSSVIHMLYSICLSLQNMLLSALKKHQIPMIWELFHEIMEYLLRLAKRDPDNLVYATYLKNMVLSSSLMFTLRKLVIPTYRGSDICVEVLKFFQSWTEGLTIMSSPKNPLQATVFKNQNGGTFGGAANWDFLNTVLVEVSTWVDKLIHSFETEEPYSQRISHAKGIKTNILKIYRQLEINDFDEDWDEEMACII